MCAKIKCPCGSENVVAIQYGYPSQKAIQEVIEGKRYLGGCIPKEENYHCRDCGEDFKGGK